MNIFHGRISAARKFQKQLWKRQCNRSSGKNSRQRCGDHVTEQRETRKTRCINSLQLKPYAAMLSFKMRIVASQRKTLAFYCIENLYAHSGCTLQWDGVVSSPYNCLRLTSLPPIRPTLTLFLSFFFSPSSLSRFLAFVI